MVCGLRRPNIPALSTTAGPPVRGSARIPVAENYERLSRSRSVGISAPRSVAATEVATTGARHRYGSVTIRSQPFRNGGGVGIIEREVEQRRCQAPLQSTVTEHR